MKEYAIEHGMVDIVQLEAKPMKLINYKKAHEGLVISCHDVFVEYQNGILLVRRLNNPAQDILWPLGGRIERGISTEDSLKKKTWEESGLDINSLIELGVARTYFKTDPFNHNKGTDTLNIAYFAKGKGELNLDKLHEKPTIISPENYQLIRNELHPYVRDFMDKAILLIQN